MSDIIYDYIIAGSGIAGNVCAYLLAEKGNSCLILEKESVRKEKICGGGISHTALMSLKNIGMNLDSLYSKNCKKIYGDMYCYNGDIKTHKYENYFSLGVQRKIFDDFLSEQAVNMGCRIEYSQEVTEIKEYNGIYNINNFHAYNFICAVGARGLSKKYLPFQSIGISGQINGKCLLDDNIFYFWYDYNDRNSYFWMFPIGDSLWNVGIWSRFQRRDIRNDFWKGFYNHVENNFINGYLWSKKPTGEFLGIVNQTEDGIIGTGDFSGTCSEKNGGGIHYAIASAIEIAKIRTC